MPWLETYNPKINWKTKTVKFDEPTHRNSHPISAEEVVINRMKLEKDNIQETCLEDEDFVLAVMGQEDQQFTLPHLFLVDSTHSAESSWNPQGFHGFQEDPLGA